MKFNAALTCSEDTREREGAWTQLCAQHDGMIRRCVRKYVSNPQHVEEIVQETFMKAYRAIGRFRTDAKMSTWLCAIARNTAINHLRGSRRKNAILHSEYIDDLQIEDEKRALVSTQSSEPRADDALLMKERVEQLFVAMKTLSHRQREILFLHCDDLAHDEIATQLRVPRGTVCSQLFRARQRLKQRLAIIDAE